MPVMSVHRSSVLSLGGLALALALGLCQSAASGVRVADSSLILGPPDAAFNMPSDVAVGNEGRLYVLDGVNHRVVVYDARDAYQFEFGSVGSDRGELRSPLGIATGPGGKVYVADSGNHRFAVFSSEGQALAAVTLPSGVSGVPPDPTDLAVASTGETLYVTDNDNHRVCVYDLVKQSWASSWGSHGQGRLQFRYPFLMDVSKEGYLFVVEPINTRVQVLSASGKFVDFIGEWGIRPGQLFRPKGVVTDADRVYVTDSYLGRIQVFDRQGGFLGLLCDRQDRPISLVTPTGITLDVPRRRLYVVELKANRVRAMSLE